MAKLVITNWFRAFAFTLLAGALLTTAIRAGNILAGRNFRTVLPGRVYRCAQPSTSALTDYVNQYGIRTVVNLRGACPEVKWYETEVRATASLDVIQEDVTMSAGKLPATQELKRLVEILDRSDYPLLIHCRRGIDRTGLTSVIVRLLFDDVTLDEAREELGWHCGHISLGRTVAMHRFFDLYETWLTKRNTNHTAMAFREFVATGYSPGPAMAAITVTDLPTITAKEPAAVTVRAENRSSETWQLRPGTGSGIFMKYSVLDIHRNRVQEGCAGLFRAQIVPGQHVDLVLALRGIDRPGRYWLHADLHETPDVAFAQHGSEPLTLEFAVQ